MATKLDGVQTGILEAPLTVERPVYNPTSEQNERLPNPGTARANLAPSLDTPEGSQAWAAAHAHQTVLEAHVNFFDHDSDGVIWPLDTYRGFRALGFNVLASTIAFIGLHAALSYVTVDGYLPDPCFRMYVRNIHKIKHGSDTGAFDNEGRFIPQKFEDFFQKYSSAPEKDSLTKADISNGLRGQRLLADLVGRFAAYAEWMALFFMVGPKDGKLPKEDVRRLFEGRLFYEIAERNSKIAVGAEKKGE
ncbi:Caleosin-domain-containing protein [Lentinus tigrinus ALCF2SS1-7]|uniref:Caleosin-domain-containing protein n=1 Tax=Lentinus tigrinus ALCF2SS1-7 TaxID=1328758 RepID=UPI001165F24A|nr:Caleosin-domain-containing protein [Lentinus tigrinus ALCF2SS1-7]